MPEIDTRFPEWIARKTWMQSESVPQALIAGAQIAQRQQQINQQNRELLLREAAEKSKYNTLRQQAEGTVALGIILEQATEKNAWTAPETRAKVYSLTKQYPWLANTDLFKGAIQSFDNADKAEARLQLETERQTAITDRNQASIESRFDLLGQRIDAMTQMEGIKNENRTALTELKSELDIIRDAMKPRTLRPERYDLNESDRMLMKSELDAIEVAQKNLEIDSAEAQRQRDSIDAKFKKRAVSSTAEQSLVPAAGDRVTTKAQYDQLPSGTEFTGADGNKYRKP